MSGNGTTVILQDIGQRLRAEFHADAELPSDMRAALNKLSQAEVNLAEQDEDDNRAKFKGDHVEHAR